MVRLFFQNSSILALLIQACGLSLSIMNDSESLKVFEMVKVATN